METLDVSGHNDTSVDRCVYSRLADTRYSLMTLAGKQRNDYNLVGLNEYQTERPGLSRPIRRLIYHGYASISSRTPWSVFGPQFRCARIYLQAGA